MNNIAILASGSGSNAENIVKYFDGKENVNVELIITNKADAYVIERAKKLNVDCAFLTREQLKDEAFLLSFLKERKVDALVLAGYLLLIPPFLIEAFPNKIINIHPALLPKYGGKGMYGMNVHRAVVANKEKKTGISIHFVNAHYDEGQIIFQASCLLDETDTPETVADKIHLLEMEHFPKVIEQVFAC